MPRKCDEANCKKDASYNFPNEIIRLKCKDHKLPTMVTVKHKSNRDCIHPDHRESGPTRATFNLPGEKAQYCQKHKTPDMVNVNIKKLCVVCNKTQPSFGLPNSTTSHCAKCADKSIMVDLVSILCNFSDCKKNATFGIPEGKPTRCKTHATDIMIDVKNKKCNTCLLNNSSNPKQPTFGYTKPTHCIEHKELDMIDLRHSTEICKKCPTRATYSLTTKPTHCAKHKTAGMKDVVSIMCTKCNEKQAVFGTTKNELFCVNCKDENMKNIKAKMCEKCNEHQPVFNFKGESKPRFCAKCKDRDMIDVVNFRCTSCELFIVSRRAQLCAYCNPDALEKTKEMKIYNLLKSKDINFIHNKSYKTTKYRPDFLINCGSHSIILEVDENQHSTYDKESEDIRMKTIAKAISDDIYTACIFIRYNPDVFRNATKVLKIPEPSRHKKLLETINYHMDTLPDKDITVYRLFYNNFDGKYVEEYLLE